MKKKNGQRPKVPHFTAQVSGQIEDVGPGKNRLLRKKNVRDETGTYKNLKILDETPTESDGACSIDPYNKSPDLSN